jgi:hypothetical protein
MFVAALVLPSAGIQEAATPKPVTTACDLRADLRSLWDGHVAWTRMYAASAIADLPNKDATAERLLKNQADLGSSIEPFYGEAAAAKLTALLKSHVTIATQIIDAAKAGDDAKKQEVAKRWHANADEIATFLSEANPKNWPLEDMKKMMREHLELTAEEVAAHLAKDWKGDIAAYEKAHDQILKMADMLAAGITAQFPQKVK